MYIRRTRTNSTVTGEAYFTYRLVRGERIGGKVRQITLLNLGRHFTIKQEDWPLLCTRIEHLLNPQNDLIPVPKSPTHIERAAQHVFAQLVERASAASAAPGAAEPPTAGKAAAPDLHEVDIATLQLALPRCVGVEQVALHAVAQLGLIKKFTELGINATMRAAILGNLIGRIAHPASERATWNGLQNQSGLGELLDVDFTGMSHMRLYRASDLLMRHREVIEAHLFNTVQTVFGLEETVTLYDLTNTYFEGVAAANPKARHGRSKEKRTDCPLLTLGLVLDGSGFVRRSQTFAGNVSEGATLETMLTGLNAPVGALVVMDAGIATEANLAWLAQQGYRYLVVRRGGTRQFDANRAVDIKTAGGETLRLQKEASEDGKEVLLYGHSAGRETKETAMLARFSVGYEAGLKKLSEGLTKPRCEKRHDKLLERIGRLKEKSRGASQHYQVNLVLEDDGKTVKSLAWEKSLVDGTMATHPGGYCLRSNVLDWSEEKLWRTYSMLTDLESVFRSLKSELGLRPVFHSKEDRSDGHLFITVLAYQCVQVLRSQLKAAGIDASWSRLRQTLSVQRRVTATFSRKDGRTIHVRKATLAEPELLAIYKALAISPTPGGTKTLFV